jgi:hypothetical protein
VLASVFGLPADDWTAIAAMGTLSVAIAAGITAFFQLREARRSREEQAQPYASPIWCPAQRMRSTSTS